MLPSASAEAIWLVPSSRAWPGSSRTRSGRGILRAHRPRQGAVDRQSGGTHPAESRAGQAFDRAGLEIGIAVMRHAVDEAAGQRLRDQVTEAQAVATHRRQIEVIEDVERLVGDLVVGGDVVQATIATRLFLQDARAIPRQIGGCQDPAAADAGALDRGRDRALVEATFPVFGDAPEGPCQVGAVEPVAGADRARGLGRQTAAQQPARDLRQLPDLRQTVGYGQLQRPGDGDPGFSGGDRGLHHLRQRQPAEHRVGVA
jgi:hypothetical protein